MPKQEPSRDEGLSDRNGPSGPDAKRSQIG